MPRILPLNEDSASPEVLSAYREHCTIYNARITNMKATLGRSLVAFQAYMQWYPLYEEVKQILGTRLSPLFAWSISEAADSNAAAAECFTRNCRERLLDFVLRCRRLPR